MGEKRVEFNRFKTFTFEEKVLNHGFKHSRSTLNVENHFGAQLGEIIRHILTTSHSHHEWC